MNELDTLSSELAPYDPGLPVLAPLSPSPDTWGNTDVDVLTPREIDQGQRGGSVQLFGAAMPPGTTNQQAQAILTQLGGVYMSDMGALNYPGHLIQSALQFINSNATRAPYQVRRQHNFKLPNDLTGDWLAESFGNHLSGLSGTQAQKQQFLTASLTWLAKANQKLNSGREPAPRMAPTSTDPTANLTDAQFQQLVDHNNRVQAQTMAILSDRWGSCFRINIELAQAQLNKQTPAELAHLDRYTGSWPWTHMFNTVELLTAMYEMSVGAASIGTNGAEIAKEIAQFEAMLKIPSERAKYMKDPQLQARLRELYARRG